MNFAYTEQQESIRDAIGRICGRFDDQYWFDRDHDGRFPEEFYRALADDGWLGMCIGESYGGAALGISEAAVMMQTIAQSGGGMSAASSVHINLFGLNPVAVFGNDEQRRRMLPPVARARSRAASASPSRTPASTPRSSSCAP